ncbi:OmpA family protein [Pseudoalteromonas sp. T1lg10]|uniref:OmpA family protein n=1 Tax=Pseudoalteromonas sp. T1lg10 TaxID=2077093 RepID=UPI000CF6D84C|nr:OmpA family protein [Pseudoalteromonas sp. T1lg10]
MKINEFIATMSFLLSSHIALAETGSKCDKNINEILDVNGFDSPYDYTQQYQTIDLSYALEKNQGSVSYAFVSGIELRGNTNKTRELTLGYGQKLSSMGYEAVFSCNNTECGNANSLQRKLGISNTVVAKDDQFHELWVKDQQYYSLYLGKMTVFADNYFIALQHFDLTDLPTGASLHFDIDSAVLTQQARASIDNLITVINSHPQLKFRITGGTDNSGSAPYNHSLGLARARSVYTYLLAQGVMPHVLSYESVGERNPRFENTSQAGKEKNRRVDISPLIM